MSSCASKPVLALAALAISLSTPVFAQSAPSKPAMFPFVIPWDDTTTGTATDMSFLNAKPAGVNGNIVVRNGHFVESKTGQRVRFLGTNLTFHSCYPTQADAQKIAAHLAKLGINIVRIHHHDTNPLPLWDQKQQGRTKFDPAGVDRLDYLISELKKNGIYVNINLKVSRVFTPEDGFPASVKNLPSYGKPIDEFDRRMIELQKQFAKDLLTHVNPYNNLTYADDPAVAVVEINNENTFAGGPGQGPAFFAALPDYFRDNVVKGWNEYLSKKYKTTAALRTAWTASASSKVEPSNFVSSTSRWHLEDNARNVKLNTAGPGTDISAPDIDIINPTPAAPEWGKQISIGNLDLQESSAYIVSFRAKADKDRTIPLFAGVTGGDYHMIGLNAKVVLGTDWKDYRFSFVATNVMPGSSRIGLIIGNAAGNISITDFKVGRPSPDDMLPADKSLEAKNLPFPDQSTAQQRVDWRAFLVDSETDYMTEMRDYLRNDLKVKANITGSQMSYGGMTSFIREAASDFMDDHQYWQHPLGSLGTAAWKIGNTPMSDSLARWEGGVLADLAAYRVAGKPFTVSEYCHPAPSDYRAEMYPEIMSFAALQDWDMIYQFDFGGYGDSKPWEKRFEPFTPDHIQNFFAMQGDTVKEAFTPAGALMFRAGMIEPAGQKATLRLPPSGPYTVSINRAIQQWKTLGRGKMPDILANRLEVVIDPKITQPVIENSPAPNNLQPGDGVSVSMSNDGSRFIARGPKVLAAAGFFGGTTNDFGVSNFKFPDFGNNFTSFILIALDNQPLAQSKRLLLTIGGKCENLNMGWNGDRTSIGQAWGKGPTQTEGIPVTLSVANKTLKKVWALGPSGERAKPVPVTESASGITAKLGPEYQTVWYEFGS